MIPRICRVIEEKNRAWPDTTYCLQSKQPSCFAPHLSSLPQNVVLVTTLETNRDGGYDRISKAPPPSVRHQQFVRLAYPRKVLTIEPVMAFDLGPFICMIKQVEPEYVWLGLNSRQGTVELPEPTVEKTLQLVSSLRQEHIIFRPKDLQGLHLA